VLYFNVGERPIRVVPELRSAVRKKPRSMVLFAAGALKFGDIVPSLPSVCDAAQQIGAYASLLLGGSPLSGSKCTRDVWYPRKIHA
jgi:hypothetical protein